MSRRKTTFLIFFYVCAIFEVLRNSSKQDINKITGMVNKESIEQTKQQF